MEHRLKQKQANETAAEDRGIVSIISSGDAVLPLREGTEAG